MSAIKNSDKSLVKYGKEAEGAPIIQPEIREAAFYLITDFRSTLRHARDFQAALVQTYIGELDYGYQVTPEDSRKVDFWRGNVCWGITYTFTKDQQELIVERQTGAATHDPTQERITLRSKRFDEQAASGDISYLKTVPSKSDEPMVLTTHKNDVFAIRNTQQVFKDFKAGR